MITTLHIKNIGIIEELSINLNKGLNVLTGETGAGKTLIIDSIQIISGGRFSKEMIRKGENTSFIELCIYEPNSPDAIEGNIIVSREISINGRNMCKINGRMVTVNELKDFMKKYIEIHGQNDNQELLDSKTHLAYLDSYIGEEIKNLKQQYNNKYKKRSEIKNELKANLGDDKEKERKLDLLKYQLNEIEQANLKINEDLELEEKRKIIVNSEKISSNLTQVDEAISTNSIDSLSFAIKSLGKIENIDEKYEKVSTNLKNIYYELQELARDINQYKEEIDFDANERNEIEQRLDFIYSLKRKYGNTIEEILNYKNKINKEIERINNLEEYNNKLKKELKQIEDEMEELANSISIIRIKNAKELSKKINNELKDLEMKNALINIKVEGQQEFNKDGKDIVKFLISTNLGEDEKELIKIASGGEMSRVMLAIKKVLSDTDKIPVMIFDEIDTGISGNAANAVAEKLSAISNLHQVLCISHLPNIAAVADYNYYISKNIINNRTNTSIKLLKEQEVLEEIARISSGEVNEITIKYASKLRSKKAS
jgi:DNA repair protein RecN (Recombination protein N)